MDATPVYGFPFPTLIDPPNGAAQIQGLAERLEAVLAPLTNAANHRTVRHANASAGIAYTRGSTTFALIDATNLAPTIQCSGAPIEVVLSGVFYSDTGTGDVSLSPQVDGVGVDGMPSVGDTYSGDGLAWHFTSLGASFHSFRWQFTPTAGSHVIAPAWASTVTNANLSATAKQPMQWTVRELARPITV